MVDREQMSAIENARLRALRELIDRKQSELDTEQQLCTYLVHNSHITHRFSTR